MILLCPVQGPGPLVTSFFTQLFWLILMQFLYSFMLLITLSALNMCNFRVYKCENAFNEFHIRFLKSKIVCIFYEREVFWYFIHVNSLKSYDFKCNYNSESK